MSAILACHNVCVGQSASADQNLPRGAENFQIKNVSGLPQAANARRLGSTFADLRWALLFRLGIADGLGQIAELNFGWVSLGLRTRIALCHLVISHMWEFCHVALWPRALPIPMVLDDDAPLGDRAVNVARLPIPGGVQS